MRFRPIEIPDLRFVARKVELNQSIVRFFAEAQIFLSARRLSLHSPRKSKHTMVGQKLMKIQFAALLCSVVLLSGCGTSTPIQRYSESKSKFTRGVPLMSHNYPDEDLYRVYVQGATGFVPISALREDVEDRAQKFCERQGKHMVLLGEEISKPPYILGNFPRIEIVFAAVNKP